MTAQYTRNNIIHGSDVAAVVCETFSEISGVENQRTDGTLSGDR